MGKTVARAADLSRSNFRFRPAVHLGLFFFFFY